VVVINIYKTLLILEYELNMLKRILFEQLNPISDIFNA